MVSFLALSLSFVPILFLFLVYICQNVKLFFLWIDDEVEVFFRVWIATPMARNDDGGGAKVESGLR
jgi:hypothetical protein